MERNEGAFSQESKNLIQEEFIFVEKMKVAGLNLFMRKYHTMYAVFQLAYTY